MSQDSDVGNTTLMYVGWKRSTETAEESKPPGVFLDQEEINKLREVWEKYGKPRIPAQSSAVLWPIVTKVRTARSEPHKLEDMNLRIAAEMMRQHSEDETETDAPTHFDVEEGGGP